MSSARNRRQKKTSKGLRRNIVAGVRSENTILNVLDSAINKIDSWRKGQNPWITVETVERNKPFIRVRANSVWGDHRRRIATSTGDAQ